jgi:hypothetical protein
MKNNSIISEFLEPVREPLSEVAGKIIKPIIVSYRDLDFAIKWKRLTFAVNQDFHHWLFAVQVTKNSIGIVFHFGGLLEDENSVFIKGKSPFLRKLEFNCIEAVDWEMIDYFIEQSLLKLEYFKLNWEKLNK